MSRGAVYLQTHKAGWPWIAMIYMPAVEHYSTQYTAPIVPQHTKQEDVTRLYGGWRALRACPAFKLCAGVG
jgi:hypothetical protein